MNDVTPTDMAVQDRPEKRRFWRNLSPVWLVPLFALGISLYIAWEAYKDRGVKIEIEFESAQGVVAGETAIRYRDVVIGEVEEVSFTDDLTHVKVEARINEDVAQYLDEGAEFWVVRPQVSTRGISGLDTVLSGVYIEGSWDTEPGQTRREFLGLSQPPLVQQGRPGRRITLKAAEGAAVTADAPVLFRGIEVGQLEKPRLSEDGESILVDAFIESPHDQRLTSATRFWDTSGFTVSLGISGFDLDFGSLASLVSGGVTFDSIYDGAPPVESGHQFSLFPDEETARQSVDVESAAGNARFMIVFNEAVNGLKVGSPVYYGGVVVGYVLNVDSRVRNGASGAEVQRVVEIGMSPERIGMSAEATQEEVNTVIAAAINSGLRARLNVSGLLSQELNVELITVTGADDATLDMAGVPYPVIPSTASDLPDLTASAEAAIERFNQLPLEDTLYGFIDLMDALETVVRSEGVQQTPDAVLALVDEARLILANEALDSLPTDISTAMGSLNTALVDLQRGGAIKALNRALINLDDIMVDIELTTEKLPAMVSEIQSLTAQASALELDELIATAENVLVSAEALIASDELRELPPALADALDQVSLALAELREGGAVENVNATLATARDTASSIADVADELPALINRMDSVAARLDTVIASYGERSPVQSETISALREVRDAAQSVSNLARQIERSPNSILFGR